MSDRGLAHAELCETVPGRKLKLCEVTLEAVSGDTGEAGCSDRGRDAPASHPVGCWHAAEGPGTLCLAGCGACVFV